MKLQGVFGEDILPGPIDRALRRAISSGCRFLILEIDSPGGFVWAARQAAEVLASAPPDITIVCYISRAISASVWITAASDEVYISSSGVAGGAVVYNSAPNRAAEAVDKKVLSIHLAEVERLLSKGNQNVAIYRAMIDIDAELWRCVSGEISSHDSGTCAAPAGECSRVLGPNQVLTMTATQSQELGFAKMFDGPLDFLQDIHGLSKYLESAAPGAAYIAEKRRVEMAVQVVEKNDRAREKMESDISASVVRVADLVKRARNADPRREQYFYDNESLILTPQSQIRWRANIDNCIVLWDGVKSALLQISGEISSMNDLVSRGNRARTSANELLGIERYGVLSEWKLNGKARAQLDSFFKESERMTNWCRDHRVRYGVDDHRRRP